MGDHGATIMLELIRRRVGKKPTFSAIVRNACGVAALLLACGASGCSCQKTDEEILKERIDTPKVHLYLASKIAIMKSDQPEGKKASESLMALMTSLKGLDPNPTVPPMTSQDVLTLVTALYSLQSEGKQLLRSGDEKGMKPILPILFTPGNDLAKVLDMNTEHAFLLTGLFAVKFHPKSKLPIPDEIVLYEAWMTDADKLSLEGLVPLVRAMKAILYANNELCDLARKEGEGAERTASKLNGQSLNAAFSTISGSPSSVTESQAKQTIAATRALTHGMAAVCFKKRDKGDDEKKFIEELDGFLKAADEMGIKSSETVFLRAYVAIKRGQREDARKLLETVRDDPTTDEATKKDLENLIAHLNDDGFIAGYFDNAYFIKTMTFIVLRRLDEAGVFDPIKQSDLVKTVDSYIGATGQVLAKGKDVVSTDGIKDKIKDLTGGK